MAKIANPAPAAKAKKEKGQPMPKKKKLKKKKKNPAPRGHSGGASKPHRPRRKKNGAASSVPRGMAMVPVSSLGGVSHSPRPKRKKKRTSKCHHHPKKKNPEGESHMHQAGAAVGLGFGAALAGMAGGYALSKAGLQSKAANVAANVAAGTLVGGGLGLIDRTAGTIVSHNYGVAAMQWALAPSQPTRAASGGDTMRRVTTRAPMRQLRGADELDGVIVDNMGDPNDVDGYEKLEGVIVDNMGDPNDVDGYEKLEGVVADNMGAADELDGFDDLGAEDEIGDADLF